MNEDQLYDAAEREMDIYRRQLERARAEAKHYRESRNALTDRIETLIGELAASAAATRPSRKSTVEDECAIALRKLLDDA